MDKRNQHFVSAEVQQKALQTIILPCATLRDYFYRLPSGADKDAETTFYEILRVPPSAFSAELASRIGCAVWSWEPVPVVSS